MNRAQAASKKLSSARYIWAKDSLSIRRSPNFGPKVPTAPLPAPQPFVRQVVGGALVVEGEDFVLKQLVEAVGVAGVLILREIAGAVQADRPAVQAVVPFRPPPVEHRDVEDAVD